MSPTVPLLRQTWPRSMAPAFLGRLQIKPPPQISANILRSALVSTLAEKGDLTFKDIRKQAFAEHSINPYPRYEPPSPDSRLFTIPEIVDQWLPRLANGEKDSSANITIHARISGRREASKKLVFLGAMQLGRTIQFVLSKARFLGSESEFTTLHRLIKPGDVVRAQGFVGKTNSGELSLFLTSLKLLAPCLHDLPFKSGLRGSEKRFRNRHVDFLVNDTPARVLLVRSKVLHFIRNYLNARNFIEVETPILSTEVGGANAQPFVTRSTAMGDLDLYLRIAPELFLKKLVIGGVERVYEIGKQFRNEGVDADHNPEFTTCEFYQAYTNLEGLMSTTEEMMQGMAIEVTGSDLLSVPQRNDSGDVSISFRPPFRRISIVPYLESKLRVVFPDLNSPDAAEKLLNICNASGAPPVQEPINVPRILDHLISTFIEPECVQPTFLVNHPAIMCPLAKTIDPEGQISGRFELFVNTKEIVNAYEELNDPDEQRRRFMVQLKDRLSGDAEVPVPDNEFCDALEFGLPPTGGWGMGIDRVVALLAGVKHLRETIAFPIMRPHA